MLLVNDVATVTYIDDVTNSTYQTRTVSLLYGLSPQNLLTDIRFFKQCEVTAVSVY